MKSLIVLFILFFGINILCNSQSDPKDGHYIIYPVPYPFVREADMMWSKTVWRMMDLREKINLPIYYPTTPMDNRYSLIDLLLYGIKKEGIVAYSPDEQDEFSKPLTWKDIEEMEFSKEKFIY